MNVGYVADASVLEIKPSDEVLVHAVDVPLERST